MEDYDLKTNFRFKCKPTEDTKYTYKILKNLKLIVFTVKIFIIVRISKLIMKAWKIFVPAAEYVICFNIANMKSQNIGKPQYLVKIV